MIAHPFAQQRRSSSTPLHRPSNTRQSNRSTATFATSTSKATLSTHVSSIGLIKSRRTVPERKNRQPSTFGSNFVHRQFSDKLPSLAWTRHDPVVDENFWRAECSKVERNYHAPADDLVGTNDKAASATAASGRPIPVQCLRGQDLALPNLGSEQLVKEAIAGRLNKTCKQYEQMYRGAVATSKERQVVLDSPVRRYRHHLGRRPAWDAPSAQNTHRSSIPEDEAGRGARQLLLSRMQKLEATIGERSPTPLYPWKPPDLDEVLAQKATAPLTAEMAFAEKVLNMMPGRKL